jgi:hypothetical protein
LAGIALLDIVATLVASAAVGVLGTDLCRSAVVMVAAIALAMRAAVVAATCTALAFGGVPAAECGPAGVLCRSIASRTLARTIVGVLAGIALLDTVATIAVGAVGAFGAGWRGSAVVMVAVIATGIRAAAVVAGSAIGTPIVTVPESAARGEIIASISATRVIDRPTA